MACLGTCVCLKLKAWLAWVLVRVWLKAEVYGGYAGIEGEDGVVGAGAEDQDPLLNTMHLPPKHLTQNSINKKYKL